MDVFQLREISDSVIHSSLLETREKMGKTVIKAKDFNKQEAVLDSAKKILGEECVCCIVISCSKPSRDKQMEVEMHYEGDESLAAFLLESANQVFEEKLSQRKSK